MSRKHTVAVLVVALSALIVGALPAGAQGSSSDASTTDPTTVQQLFVQTADRGRLVPVKGSSDTYTLTLRGIAPLVTAFTDRPLRVASAVNVSDFVGNWQGGTFESDPPNAALVLTDGKTKADTFIVELTDPEYDRGADTLTYTATLIADPPTGRLADYADRVDDKPPASFGRSSLFIDSLPTQSMTVEVTGIPAGDFGGFIIDGYTSLFRSNVIQGDISQIFGGANGVVLLASSTQTGTATVELEIYFCVPQGKTTATINASGDGPGTILAFDLGTGVQEITTAGGSIDVPASYQVEDCGS